MVQHKHIMADCREWHPHSTHTVGDAELAADYSATSCRPTLACQWLSHWRLFI